MRSILQTLLLSAEELKASAMNIEADQKPAAEPEQKPNLEPRTVNLDALPYILFGSVALSVFLSELLCIGLFADHRELLDRPRELIMPFSISILSMLGGIAAFEVAFHVISQDMRWQVGERQSTSK